MVEGRGCGLLLGGGGDEGAVWGFLEEDAVAFEGSGGADGGDDVSEEVGGDCLASARGLRDDCHGVTAPLRSVALGAGGGGLVEVFVPLVGAGPLLGSGEGSVERALDSVGGFEPVLGECGEFGDGVVHVGVFGGGLADFAEILADVVGDFVESGDAGDDGGVDEIAFDALADHLGELFGVSGELLPVPAVVVVIVGEGLVPGLCGPVVEEGEVGSVGGVLGVGHPGSDGLLDFGGFEAPDLDVFLVFGDGEGEPAALAVEGGELCGSEEAVGDVVR